MLLDAATGILSVSARTSVLGQPHGHLELFGFAGTLVFAAGFAWLSSTAGVIPSDSRAQRANVWPARLIWACWTAGILIRCLSRGHAGLTASSALEFSAFLAFACCLVRGGASRRLHQHRRLPVIMMAGAFLAFGLTLLAGVVASVHAVPLDFSNRVLLLATWGFMGPMVWAASAQWLTDLLGLKPLKSKILIAACVLDLVGLAGALAGKIHLATVLLLHAAIFVPSSLKVFGRSQRPARINHPGFVRVAYGWLRVAATLGVWASVHDAAPLWSGSRHALTVGFVVVLVFATADWWLPRVTVTGPLFYLRLTRAALLTLNAGCGFYVAGRIIAHLGVAPGVPLTVIGALLEFAAIVVLLMALAMAFVRLPAEPEFAPAPE